MPSDHDVRASAASARHRRVVTVAVLTVGSVLIGFIGLSVAASIALSHLFEVKHRKHLDPIPIDASACPYVKAMHRAANQFQKANPVFGVAFDAQGNQLRWPETRSRVRHAADALEYSIAASIPHVPPRVKWYLTTTRNDVHDGRQQLGQATDAFDFTNRTNALLQDGQLAFGYAGDLIGHQCSVQLGADSNTMLYPLLHPFLTTTSSLPAART